MAEKPALDGLLKEKSVTVDGQFLTESPAQIRCYKCGNTVQTSVTERSAIGTWIGCCLLW